MRRSKRTVAQVATFRVKSGQETSSGLDDGRSFKAILLRYRAIWPKASRPQCQCRRAVRALLRLVDIEDKAGVFIVPIRHH